MVATSPDTQNSARRRSLRR